MEDEARGLELITNGHRVYFGIDENVLKLIIVMIAQSCEYTKAIDLYTLNG